MNPSYIFIIISILNFGFSLYILRKIPKKEQSVDKPVDLIQVKSAPKIIESTNVLKKIEVLAIVEKVKPTIIEKPIGIVKNQVIETPIIEEIKPIINESIPFNEWKLNIGGNLGVTFDVRVKWSDKTKDKMTGSAPMNFNFKKSKGITPIHITNYSHNVTHVWELNGYTWS